MATLMVVASVERWRNYMFEPYYYRGSCKRHHYRWRIRNINVSDITFRNMLFVNVLHNGQYVQKKFLLKCFRQHWFSLLGNFHSSLLTAANGWAHYCSNCLDFSTFLFLAYDPPTQLFNYTYLFKYLRNNHTYVGGSAWDGIIMCFIPYSHRRSLP